MRSTYYFDKNVRFDEPSSPHVEILWKKIGQVRFDNLGPLFQNEFQFDQIIKHLLEYNQNFYHVLDFCEKNENAVELEIIKRKKERFDNRTFKGYQIYASCQLDFTSFIQNENTHRFDESVTVKWICNFELEQETSLNEFLEMIRDLHQNEKNEGIHFKQVSPIEKDFYVNRQYSYQSLKRLSFLYGIKKFCGDPRRLEDSVVTKRDEKHLIATINDFHKEYVESNKPPSRQTAWTFLRSLSSNQHTITDKPNDIAKGLHWYNLFNWLKSKDRLETTVELLKELAPEFEYDCFQKDSTYDSTAKLALEYGKKCINKNAVKQLAEAMTKINPYFGNTQPFNATSSLKDHFESMTEQYSMSLDRKNYFKKAEDLITIMARFDRYSMGEKVIFNVYESLFKTKIVESLKNPKSNVINVLTFFYKSIKKDDHICAISVPTFEDTKKTLLLVVNTFNNEEKPSKQELMSFIKGKEDALPRFQPTFSIMFDNQISTEKPAQLNAAFEIIRNLLSGIDVNRIDGEIVTEESASSDKSTDWVATKLIVVIHLFLSSYYDDLDYRNVCESNSKQKINELIDGATLLLNEMETKLKEGDADALQPKIETLSNTLFKISEKLEWIVLNIPEITDHFSVRELCNQLMAFMKLKLLPRRSSFNPVN